MTPYEIERSAKILFDSGLACAESVLKAIADQASIDSPLIPTIATGFCGGMARTKGTCGAVSGGIMAIGMIFGMNMPDISRDEFYARIQQFMSRFEQLYGSTNCFDLTGCDFNSKEELHRWREQGIRDKCREMTGSAAKLVSEMVSCDIIDRANFSKTRD